MANSYSEHALFQHWRGAKFPDSGVENWASIVRQGHTSVLMDSVETGDNQEYLEDLTEDYCKHVDAILWCDWDPLSVNQLNACRNEYHEFAWDVARATFYGTEPQLIAELFALEAFYFNVEKPDTLARAERVAKKLLQLCRVNCY